jgi:hypothetical protein
MAVTPSRARRFSSTIGDGAVRFGDRILIAPAFGHPLVTPIEIRISA